MRKRSGRPIDGQKSRLYNWEHAHIQPGNKELMTEQEVLKFVHKVYADINWPAANVRFPSKGQRGRARAAGFVISLPPWTRTRFYVLHEIAHTLTPAKYEAHGPQYTRILINLVVKYGGGDEVALYASAYMMGVRVANEEPKEFTDMKMLYDITQPINIEAVG